jgi:uncharacterized membrane protein
MSQENLIELWNVYVAISEGEPVSLVQWIAAIGTIAGIIGSIYTLWWFSTKGARLAGAPLGWIRIGDVCRAAIKLLESADTQTDQKKLGIDAMGSQGTETTVKAGLLVVTLESGGIALHGTDLSAKLHRRERRRILRCAKRRRAEILAQELETARQEAAELMARKPGAKTSEPGGATTGFLGGVSSVLQVPFNGDPRGQAGASLSPATRRLADECNLNSGGKPVACAGCR